MKKFYVLNLFLALFLIGCSNSSSNQATDNQATEEVTTLDSLNNDLEATIKEIDQTEAELNAALEELND